MISLPHLHHARRWFKVERNHPKGCNMVTRKLHSTGRYDWLVQAQESDVTLLPLLPERAHIGRKTTPTQRWAYTCISLNTLHTLSHFWLSYMLFYPHQFHFILIQMPILFPPDLNTLSLWIVYVDRYDQPRTGAQRKVSNCIYIYT